VFKGKSVEDFPVTSIVKSWCLSNAGNQIALGFRNGNVEIHSLQTDDKPLLLERHEQTVRHCSFSSKDTHLVSCSDDGTHTLWDLVEGTECVHVQPGDSSDADYEARYRELASKRRRSSHQAIQMDSRRSNRPCAFFNHVVHVVSGSLSGEIVIWPGDDGQQVLHTLEGHKDPVLTVAVSNDDQYVASASVDQSTVVGICIMSKFNNFLSFVICLKIECRLNFCCAKLL
jgi:WD40 repeat protein